MGQNDRRNGSVVITILLVSLAFGITLIAAYQLNLLQFRNSLSQKFPALFGYVDQKVETMHTAKPPIGDLAPVRELKGTWSSSIKGKGIQLYGQFAAGPGTVKLYEDGDIELIINTMEGNTAAGTIRYTNLNVTGTTTIPGSGTVGIPSQHIRDSGTSPIQIRVSGSRLDFGTISTNSVTTTMQGNYTTDLISGTMTATVESYGVLKGEFHLMREK